MGRHVAGGCVVGAAVIVMAACGADAEREVRLPELQIRPERLVATPIPLASGISPENDGFGFAFAVDLRVTGNTLTVLENGNARLVLFDSTFRAVRTIGREGAGPGELRGVFSMDVASGAFAVAEINNARISIFDTSGTYRRSVAAAGEAAFAFGPDGSLLVVAGSPDHYLVRIDSTGFRQPFGDRPVHLYPVAVQRDRVLPGVGRELVITGPGGDVFVFDRVLAGLARFDHAGNSRGITVLPRRFREALLEHQGRVYADFGDRRPVYEVAASDLTRTDAGELLLLFPVVEGTFGLLIDPGDDTATRVEWPAESDEAARAAAGGFGVVRGDRLYRGLGDEVTVFRLDPAR